MKPTFTERSFIFSIFTDEYPHKMPMKIEHDTITTINHRKPQLSLPYQCPRISGDSSGGFPWFPHISWGKNMVSEDHLAAPAWTALLEQPPCCLRGCRARCPFGGWNQLAAAAMLGDSGWMNRSAYFCNLFYVYIYIYTCIFRH